MSISTTIQRFALASALVFTSACETVPVQPVLGTSLGFEAYRAMGEISIRDASIGVYIEPELAELMVERKINLGEFSFPVGEAFSAKLIKGVAHNFRTVVLLDSPAAPADRQLDAIMRVGVQDIDFEAKAKGGWSAVTASTYIRTEIRAEIRDVAEDRIVWVGTTSAQQEGTHLEHYAMTYQEAGRGFAMSVDKAIDAAVGDLLRQVGRSSNLQSYFQRWESREYP